MEGGIVLKKVLVFAIIWTLLLGMIAYSAAFPDVQGTGYEKAVSLLEHLNVVNGYADGTFGSDRTVTRAEFSVMLSRLLNLSGSVAAGYQDIPSGYWAETEISRLTAAGIISGVGGGAFEPESPITLSQAIKMLVVATGYGVQAEQNGGYPYGYLIIGKSCGLSDGISAANTGEMTRGQLAQMLYNAANIDVMEVASAGSEIRYQVMKDETLLSKYHDIYRVEGQVTGTYRAGLSGGAVARGRIRIDGEVYLLDDNAAAINDLLGYQVEAYYRMPEQNGDKTVFYAYQDIKHSDVLEIKCEDVISFQDNRLEYATERKTASVRIEPSASVLFNGVELPSYTQADFMRDAGSITLLEHPEGGYRFVSIKGYDTYVVSRVVEEKIYNKYRPEKVFELGKQDEDYALHDVYGQPIAIGEISENDVLSVLETPEGDYVDITWIADRVTGTLEEMGKDGDKDSYVVAGRRVTLSRTLSAAFADNLEKEPVIGQAVRLSLDIEGKAAGLESDDALDENLALLVDGSLEKGIDKTITLRLLSANNKDLKLPLAQRVRHSIDGEVQSIDDSQMLEILKNGGELVERQVMIYQQNAKGEIIQIETAIDKEQRADEHCLYRYPIADKMYKTSPMSFEGVASVDNDTVVFMHPEDDSRDLSENYDVRSPSSFTNDVRYAVTAYAKGIHTLPLLALSMPIETKIADDSSLFLVDKVSAVVNAEGDSVKKLYGMQAGAAANAVIRDDEVFETAVIIGTSQKAAVSSGDVIRLSRDNQNNVIRIEVVYDYESSGDLPWGAEPARTNSYNTYTNVLHMLYGPVTLRDGGFIQIMSGKEAEIHKVDKVKIMVYDNTKREPELRVGTIEDIVDMNTPDASRVLLRSRYGEVRDLIIFK